VSTNIWVSVLMEKKEYLDEAGRSSEHLNGGGKVEQKAYASQLIRTAMMVRQMRVTMAPGTEPLVKSFGTRLYKSKSEKRRRSSLRTNLKTKIGWWCVHTLKNTEQTGWHLGSNNNEKGWALCGATEEGGGGSFLWCDAGDTKKDPSTTHSYRNAWDRHEEQKFMGRSGRKSS